MWEIHKYCGEMMKEVKLGRFVAPFSTVPFEHYIQSPVVLIPKGEDDRCLIFHLSYPRMGVDANESINAGTPRGLCSVKYKDVTHAIQSCIQADQGVTQQRGT